jgi:hypothetical protein
MTFLQSLFLWGLAAAVLPVVIHLLNRPRARVVPFSTLEFIRRLQIKRSRRIRIREMLLLLLRVLLLVLLGLAFARPALQGVRAAGLAGRARTSACIVLDVSASMGLRSGDGTLLDRAKERAREAASLLDEGDEALLVLASDAPASLFESPTHDLKLLDAEIEKAALTSRGTDLARSLDEAFRSLEKARNPNREIYLVTDMQEAGFPDSPAEPRAPLQGTARVFLLPVGDEERPNRAITEAELYEPRTLGETVRVRATVADHSDQAADVVVNLVVDGEPRGTSALRIPPRGSESVLFSLLVEERGALRGEIRLEPDRLARDDTHYFVLNRPEKLDVLVVGPAEEPGLFFVRSALDPGGPGAGPIRAETADPTALRTARLESYAALFLVGVPSIGEKEALRLAQYVEGGGGLVLVPGDAIDFGAYNTLLLDALMGSVRFGGSVAPSSNGVRIDELQEEHPIFSVFRQGLAAALRDVRVERRLALDGGEGATTLARTGGGEPLLIEAKKGAGRVFLWTIGHDLSWSDLPAQSVYLPLLHESVRYLTSGGALGRTSREVGEPYRRDLSGAALGGEFSCATPLERVALQPRAEGDRLILEFDGTGTPGIYHIEGNGLSDWFAVNMAPAESDLDPLPLSEAAGRLGVPDLRTIAPDAKPERPVMEARFGREFWWEVLVLVLVLAAVETAVARSHRPSAPDRG